MKIKKLIIELLEERKERLLIATEKKEAKKY